MKKLANDIEMQIKLILEEYALGIENGVEEVADKVTKKGAKTLKATSPKRRPKYFAGWQVTKQPLGVSSIYIIHNAKYPGLPHLLEFGHATVNGGRTMAQPHIKPVEVSINEEFEKEVKKLIENG